MPGPRERSRCWLAVPAHRSHMVAKAAASEADAVYLDLEDSVPLAEKAAALESAARAVEALDWGARRLAVRINAPLPSGPSPEASRLASLPRLDALILPKAEDVAEVRRLADLLRAGAGDRGRPVEIELLVETARGLALVEALAPADPLVVALHLGVGDLAASLGARAPGIGLAPEGYVHLAGEVEVPHDLYVYPMMRLLVAARAFGLRAIDGPYGDYGDARASAAAARKAAAMGFDGKQVIHPSQIGPTQLAFRPSEAELGLARRIVEALSAAEASGTGAASVDGRMVDAADLRRVRRILDLSD